MAECADAERGAAPRRIRPPASARRIRIRRMTRSGNALPSRRTARLFGQIAVALGIALAGYLIYRGVSHYGFAEIVRSVGSVPASSLMETAAYTAASYLCLTGFEWL